MELDDQTAALFDISLRCPSGTVGIKRQTMARMGQHIYHSFHGKLATINSTDDPKMSKNARILKAIDSSIAAGYEAVKEEVDSEIKREHPSANETQTHAFHSSNLGRLNSHFRSSIVTLYKRAQPPHTEELNSSHLFEEGDYGVFLVLARAAEHVANRTPIEVTTPIKGGGYDGTPAFQKELLVHVLQAELDGLVEARMSEQFQAP